MSSCSSIVGVEPASAASHGPVLRVQYSVRACTIAFLVVAGTSILYIWDIKVASLSCIVCKCGLHLRNLRMLRGTLGFEYPVLTIV